MLAIAVIGALLSRNAVACPRCYPSQVARAMAFGPAFWPNLLAVSLPFIVLAAVILAGAWIGMPRASGRGARP
jgi:hypothetical protein